MVLQAHSLLANLKHRNRNLKIQKRKKLVTLMVSYLNQSRFFKAGQAHCGAGVAEKREPEQTRGHTARGRSQTRRDFQMSK